MSRQSGWLLELIEDIVTMVGDAQLEVQTWGRETSQPDATLLGLPGASTLHCLRSILVGTENFTPHDYLFPPYRALFETKCVR